MDTHTRLLKNICRICGNTKSTRERPFIPVANLKDEIYFSFLLDIAEDDENVHPSTVCHKCRSRASYHFSKKQQQTGAELGTYKRDVKIFVQHSNDECVICTPRPVQKFETAATSGIAATPGSAATSGTSTTSKTSVTPATSELADVNTVFKGLLENTSDLTAIIKNLSPDLQKKLAYSLGETQSSSIYDDALEISNAYKNPENLTYPSTSTWLSQRNAVVGAFVEGATCTQTRKSALFFEQSEKKLYAQAKAIDAIYKARYSNFVSTLSFAENLTIYSITRSKAAVNINSASSAAGGFTSIQTWLKSQVNTDAIIFPLDGDLFVAIDNEQVVGKTWRVYANRSVPTSIVTSVIAMQLPSNAQQQWLLPSIFSGHYCPDALDNIFSNATQTTSSKTAFVELKNYLRRRLDIVEAEQKATMDGWTDSIDEVLADGAVESKQCSGCGHRQDVFLQDAAAAGPKTICNNCGGESFRKSGDVLFSQKRKVPTQDSFIRIDADSSTNKNKTPRLDDGSGSNVCQIADLDSHDHDDTAPKKPELYVGDPAFVNPNSYETVTEVLRHIGCSAGIERYKTGRRKWTFVTMDGLPYTMAYKIVQETYICRTCTDLSLFGAETKTQHCEELHAGVDVCEREFDWVVLRIGAGHYEMNMKKAFMELNFVPFMSDLCRELGFKSANAQKYVQQCSDNHKAWDLMCIARECLTDELLRPYVIQSLSAKEPCTVKGFLHYSQHDVKNPNFKYIYEQVFVFLQAIMNYRTAPRENNHQLLISGKEKFAPIWFARNHPKYQQIDICDSHDRFCYPGSVQDLVVANESFSFTGKPKTGEGLDFVLENVNKKVKSFLPPGVPNADEWLRAFRNYHQLEQIRDATFSRMGITDPSSVVSSLTGRKYEEEVTKCRYLIRKSGILKHPKAECDFQSLSGKKLDKGLLEIYQRGLKNKGTYVQHLKKHGKPPKGIVYVVTCDDELTVQSKKVTKLSLAAMIEEKLGNLGNTVEADYLTELWKEVKKGKKAGFLDLFKQIKEAEVTADRMANTILE